MKPIAIVGNGLDAMMVFYRMRCEGHPFAMFCSEKSTDPVNYFGEWIAPTLPFWRGNVYKIIPQFWGESDVYSSKRFRFMSQWVSVQFPIFTREVYGINPVEFYNQCHAEIAEMINHEKELSPQWLEKIARDFDKIIIASDRAQFCKQPMFHVFRTVPVTVLVNYIHLNKGEIVYNGNQTNAWFRASNLFGDFTLVEFGDGMEPPGSKEFVVGSVVSTNCDCWTGDPRFQFVGKVAKYDHSVSLSDGFKCDL